jgi:hypothetical protein
LKNDLITVLHESAVQPVADANHRNKQLAFKPDVQYRIKRLNVKQSPMTRKNNHKLEIRRLNDGVSLEPDPD